jgi:hypothetical protein
VTATLEGTASCPLCLKVEHMNKIIVIIASLSLGLAAGCAGGLRLDSNSLFKNKKKADESSATS